MGITSPARSAGAGLPRRSAPAKRPAKAGNIAAMASSQPFARSRLSRRTVLQGFGAVAIGTAAGTVAHGFMYERHHIEVTERALDVAGWPETLSGLRIGFLTDLHRSATVSHDMI